MTAMYIKVSPEEFSLVCIKALKNVTAQIEQEKANGNFPTPTSANRLHINNLLVGAQNPLAEELLVSIDSFNMINYYLTPEEKK
jgi:hypothetical protein